VWWPLVAGPGLLIAVLAAGWFAVAALVVAVVSWPALLGVAFLGVLAARAATDPMRVQHKTQKTS
jgi:hypothetical protein